ncbi:MAG: alpha/beta hydrolase family protein [Actinomycetota bacterium]
MKRPGRPAPVAKASVAAAGLAAALLARRQAGSMAKAALLLSDIVPSSSRPLRRLTTGPRVTHLDLPFGPADLYHHPGRQVPGIVLVHGASPNGKADARVGMMASALARIGRSVLVPGLAMGERRLEPEDTQRIRSAIAYHAGLTGERVVVLAFSFGAAFTLVALEEEPDVQDHVRALATVGTYYDLVNLLAGVTTGQIPYDDELVAWQPSADAAREVTEFLGGFLDPAEAAALMAAYDSGDPSRLGEDARAVWAVMTNRDPRPTRALVAALPQRLVDLFEEMSPATRIARIRVPVWALHSHEDPAAPPSESVRLVRALEPRTDARLTIVGVLSHVTPTGDPATWLREGRGLLAYAARMIRAQE